MRGHQGLFIVGICSLICVACGRDEVITPKELGGGVSGETVGDGQGSEGGNNGAHRVIRLGIDASLMRPGSDWSAVAERFLTQCIDTEELHSIGAVVGSQFVGSGDAMFVNGTWRSITLQKWWDASSTWALALLASPEFIREHARVSTEDLSHWDRLVGTELPESLDRTPYAEVFVPSDRSMAKFIVCYSGVAFKLEVRGVRILDASFPEMKRMVERICRAIVEAYPSELKPLADLTTAPNWK
jgi:hypothetical protein